MLRNLKLAAWSGASALGLLSLAGNTRWRRDRLLILCYHGISRKDEHEWNGGLFMPPEQFRGRMELLRREASVLPLGEAVDRLYRRDLPERAVAVTFDDGWCDFHSLAVPILREFSIPATVYLTTYYCDYNRPVFDPMLSYLLWKGSGSLLSAFQPSPVRLDAAGRDSAYRAIRDHVIENELSGPEKDRLLAEVAAALQIDFEAMLRERFLHLMNPAEVAEVAAAGIDVQLHTHRHRVSREREWFTREIVENRERVQAAAGTGGVHFCYPGGNYLEEFGGWLEACGVETATTCDPGLCSTESRRHFLPRFMDMNSVREIEFRAWVSGFAALMPRRTYAPAEGQFLEDWRKQPARQG